MTIKTYILHSDADAASLAQRMAAAQITTPLRVTVEPYKKRRSLAQNSLLWLWNDCIRKWLWLAGIGGKDANGESIRPYTSEEIHELNKAMFLPSSVVEFKETQTISRKSRDLPVVLFAEFLTNIESYWQEQGCDLPHPGDTYSEAMSE